MAIARKSFVHLDRDQSGFVSKDAFVSAMVQQAVASGMPQEETSTLVKELEQEFWWVGEVWLQRGEKEVVGVGSGVEGGMSQ